MVSINPKCMKCNGEIKGDEEVFVQLKCSLRNKAVYCFSMKRT